MDAKEQQMNNIMPETSFTSHARLADRSGQWKVSFAWNESDLKPLDAQRTPAVRMVVTDVRGDMENCDFCICDINFKAYECSGADRMKWVDAELARQCWHCLIGLNWRVERVTVTQACG